MTLLLLLSLLLLLPLLLFIARSGLNNAIQVVIVRRCPQTPQVWRYHQRLLVRISGSGRGLPRSASGKTDYLPRCDYQCLQSMSMADTCAGGDLERSSGTLRRENRWRGGTSAARRRGRWCSGRQISGTVTGHLHRGLMLALPMPLLSGTASYPRVRNSPHGVAEAQHVVLQPFAPVLVPPTPPRLLHLHRVDCLFQGSDPLFQISERGRHARARRPRPRVPGCHPRAGLWVWVRIHAVHDGGWVSKSQV